MFNPGEAFASLEVDPPTSWHTDAQDRSTADWTSSLE